MKKLILLNIFFWSVSLWLTAQTKARRREKKNEIEWHFNRMWSNSFYSVGVGYERTIYRTKNKRNGFFSSQTSYMVATENFREHLTRFSSTYNQIQTFIKYSFGYQKILSFGLGTVIVDERFRLNPTALVAYKYDISKIRTTVSMQFLLSQHDRIPPIKSNGPFIPTSIGGKTQYSFTIFRHWSFGVSIGKYF